jgi:hypothetical protein
MKIALALKSELKDRNSRAKLIAGWTGANERTVKNWILGRYAPCGRHLVGLARHSDQVLNAILLMADRQDLLLARKVEDLRRRVLELAALMGGARSLSSVPDHAVGAVPPTARDYHDADGTLHFLKRGLQYTTPDNT